MPRYQVFLPPAVMLPLTGEQQPLIHWQTYALPNDSGLLGDATETASLACTDPSATGGCQGEPIAEDVAVLASPFSLVCEVSTTNPALGSARSGENTTYNYAGAIDADTQSQNQSHRRSKRVRENSESQSQKRATGTTIVSSGSSYNTTTSTLPLSNTNHASSLGQIPQYRIPLHRLAPLSRLLASGSHQAKGPVTLLVCVVQVDEYKVFRTEEDRRKGREGTGRVGNWNVVMPPTTDSAEVGGQITFWGDWATGACQGQVRRGDVVLIENASYTPTPAPTVSLTTRSRPAASFKVLYRTIPRYETTAIDDYRYRGHRPGLYPTTPSDHPPTSRTMIAEDRALRPDMRLGRSDVAIRKVAELARWFASWVGGEPPGPH